MACEQAFQGAGGSKGSPNVLRARIGGGRGEGAAGAVAREQRANGGRSRAGVGWQSMEINSENIGRKSRFSRAKM